jgi:hypothetical protein
VLGVAAAAFVAVAIGVYGGGFAPAPLVIVSIGWALAVAAAVLGKRAPEEISMARTARLLLVAAVVPGIVWQIATPPGLYLQPPLPADFRMVAVLVAGVAATYAVPLPPNLARWRFPAVVACFAYMAWVVIRASPKPFIDVWWIQQIGAQGLLHGHNPYTLTFPNIYGDDGLFGPGLVENGRILFYPYPPLSLLLGGVAYLIAGDVRVLFAAMMVVAAISAWWLCRGEVGELAAIALLMQPRSFLVLEQAWTEPVVLAMLGATLIAVRRLLRGPRSSGIAAGIAGGLLVVSKQFSGVIAIPLLFALPSKRRPAVALIAVAVVVALLVPFAASDAAELWRDLVKSHVLQPFRADALSWLVPPALALGRPLPAAIGFVAGIAVLAATVTPGGSIAQALRAAAAAFLTLVLFNKQAFTNYYWLGVGILLLSVVAQVDPVLGTMARAPKPGAFVTGQTG